jgi:hypothetical protein
MLRRIGLILTAASLWVAAAGVAAVTAFGDNEFPGLWDGGDQPLSDSVRSSPISKDVSDDTKHVLRTSEPNPIGVRLPLRLPDGSKIEAGRRSDGAVCFNVTIPGQPNAGSCGASVADDRISGVVARARGKPAIYAGLAGDDVTAVTVMTDRGPIEAVVQNGAFLAIVPKGVRLESWTATLSDGSRTTSSLTMTNVGDPLVDE